MSSQPYTDLDKGNFLIASPEIESGLFKRAVILLCEHSSTGSFGLIVNKELDIELPDDLKEADASLNSDEIHMRIGGPLQSNQMMLLHSYGTIPDQTLQVAKNIYLGGDLQFLQDTVNNNDTPELLLCLGYCGWLGGKLEREFLDGDWFLTPAKAEDVFTTPPDKL
ncbi:MAG: YqgE/AlgH family protein, partial [Simkaniaceae bacterium]|nr:YqgE/AlgH family protein [Simkaniaceae bacterium]